MEKAKSIIKNWDLAWKPGDMLIDALEPSTSKQYVLPRYERTLFSNQRLSTNSGDFKDVNVVLKNFYELEKYTQPSAKYFECVQSEITVEMRQILVEWMLEVCEGEHCSSEVFPLAVSYLDRFLSIEAIHKHQLQALGIACLFLASKVKEPIPFMASRLSQYSDYSVPVSELLAWELLVLNRLKWDLASLTAFDFLDQFFHDWRIPHQQLMELRSALNCLVYEAAINFSWAVLLPSEIAKRICSIVFGNTQSHVL